MLQKNSSIKIAVIGVGYWGPNLIRNFYQLPDVQVSFVCDLDESKMDNIKKFYPAIQVTTNYLDVVKNKEIDALCVATPLAAHHQIAQKALLNGKHVLVEKPLASNSKEAKELIQLAEKKKKILMVDHTFIFTGAVQKIKELIDKGEIGKINYFDSERINLGLIRPDSNVIWDLAPHDFSIMDYLFKEEPEYISAVASKHFSSGLEEMAHITLVYKNNLIGHVHLSWLSPVKLRKILIGGSKKMILYDDVEPTEKIRIYDKGIDIDSSEITPFNPLYRSGDVLIPKLDQTEALKKVAEHFLDCIKKNKKPLTNGEAGLRVVKMLEATQQSIKKGGRLVKIN
jgi:predicted dehydrogenase